MRCDIFRSNRIKNKIQNIIFLLIHILTLLMLTLVSLLLFSLSSQVAASPCVAFDANWNLYAFGFNGKDFNAGTSDTWASGISLHLELWIYNLLLRCRNCIRRNCFRQTVSFLSDRPTLRLISSGQTIRWHQHYLLSLPGTCTLPCSLRCCWYQNIVL